MLDTMSPCKAAGADCVDISIHLRNTGRGGVDGNASSLISSGNANV